jgi:hypothetical protein
MSAEVWIGLVEVTPNEGNDAFEGYPGGFTNVLALAASLSEYESKVSEALNKAGFTAHVIEDAEPVRERAIRTGLDEDFVELADSARAGDVVWSTFHIFEGDEES